MIIFNISGWPNNGLFPPQHDMTIMETWGSKTYQNRILEVHPPLLDFVWSCTIVVSRVNMVKPPRNHQALSPASPGLENFLMSDEPSWCSCWAVVIQRALGYENANMETIYGWFTLICRVTYYKLPGGMRWLKAWEMTQAHTHTHAHQCGTVMVLTGLPRLLGNSAMAWGFLACGEYIYNNIIYII